MISNVPSNQTNYNPTIKSNNKNSEVKNESSLVTQNVANIKKDSLEQRKNLAESEMKVNKFSFPMKRKFMGLINPNLVKGNNNLNNVLKDLSSSDLNKINNSISAIDVGEVLDKINSEKQIIGMPTPPEFRESVIDVKDFAKKHSSVSSFFKGKKANDIANKYLSEFNKKTSDMPKEELKEIQNWLKKELSMSAGGSNKMFSGYLKSVELKLNNGEKDLNIGLKDLSSSDLNKINNVISAIDVGEVLDKINSEEQIIGMPTPPEFRESVIDVKDFAKKHSSVSSFFKGEKSNKFANKYLSEFNKKTSDMPKEELEEIQSWLKKEISISAGGSNGMFPDYLKNVELMLNNGNESLNNTLKDLSSSDLNKINNVISAIDVGEVLDKINDEEQIIGMPTPPEFRESVIDVKDFAKKHSSVSSFFKDEKAINFSNKYLSEFNKKTSDMPKEELEEIQSWLKKEISMSAGGSNKMFSGYLKSVE